MQVNYVCLHDLLMNIAYSCSMIMFVKTDLDLTKSEEVMHTPIVYHACARGQLCPPPLEKPW